MLLDKKNWKSLYHFAIVFKRTLIIWGLIVIGSILAIYLGASGKIVSLVIIVVGIISNAFAGLVAMFGVLPVVGPIIVKVLALPFFWILNAMGYFVSIVAIKKGHGKTVMNYRVLTTVFLVGVVLGYILGKII